MASNGQSSNGISPGSIVTTVNRSTTGEGVKFRAFDKLARECGKSIHDFNSVLFDVLNANDDGSEDDVKPLIASGMEFGLKTLLMLDKKPVWMSRKQFVSSLRPIDPEKLASAECKGCLKKFPSEHQSSGYIRHSLDYQVHCIEECPLYKKLSLVRECRRCQFKFLDHDALSHHDFVAHKERNVPIEGSSSHNSDSTSESQRSSMKRGAESSLTNPSSSKTPRQVPTSTSSNRAMNEMVGGCCICSDESGSRENPLVFCDGDGCNVAVHRACYGIESIPRGPWFCKRCESQELVTRVRCELCPSKHGAFKRTDKGTWAHVLCALYIPEVRFGSLTTMDPIMIEKVPRDRFGKSCYICMEQGRDATRSNFGACMQCNKSNCTTYFHVTCAQELGLLCEEAGNLNELVKYCGYCQHHYEKLIDSSYKVMFKGSSTKYTFVSMKPKENPNIKPIPAFKPIPNDE